MYKLTIALLTVLAAVPMTAQRRIDLLIDAEGARRTGHNESFSPGIRFDPEFGTGGGAGGGVNFFITDRVSIETKAAALESRLHHVPTVAQLAAFGLALTAAVVVVYALWVALMSLAFWFVSVENLSVLFDAVYEGARYPVSAYPGALRFVFVYLIPIAWTTTIPASALTGRLEPGFALVAAAVAGVAFALTRLLWRTALKRYSGASG